MNLVQKMIRASMLDIQLYEEVEKDQEATRQAYLVVLIAGICSGVGTIEVGRMDRINKRAAFRSDRMAFVEWYYIPYGNAA